MQQVARFGPLLLKYRFLRIAIRLYSSHNRGKHPALLLSTAFKHQAWAVRLSSRPEIARLDHCPPNLTGSLTYCLPPWARLKTGPFHVPLLSRCDTNGVDGGLALADGKAQRAHLPIQVASLKPECLGRAAHVAMAVVNLLEDVIALISLSGMLERGKLLG